MVFDGDKTKDSDTIMKLNMGDAIKSDTMVLRNLKLDDNQKTKLN